MTRKITGIILAALAALFLLAALVSLGDTNAGSVRLIDLVREPAIYVATILLLCAAIAGGRWRWWSVAGFGLTIFIHLYRMWPYLFAASTQIALDDNDPGRCFTVLSLNVYQDNDQYGRVAALIEREAPDAVLLMETNQAWLDALAPQLSAFETQIAEPLDNTYGMVFAANLPVKRAEMSGAIDADTPTFYATLTAGNGADFEFVGLHPRPPLPGEDTKQRDRIISRAGARTPDGLTDVLVMGDFNDVPWSTTTTTFREEGDFRDPRAGRGTYPTFPAEYVFAGWPLDQVLVAGGMQVAEFAVLEDVGADHLPMRVTACLAPGAR